MVQFLKSKKMRTIKNNFLALMTASLIFWMAACQQPGVNTTGSEYMPDMAHSIAYEANVHSYYFLNTWDEESVVKSKDMSVPRQPVNGTIPRGYAGVALAQSDAARMEMMELLKGNADGAISVPVNGHVPYYYEDTEEERVRAKAEIIENPFPITAEGLAVGKNLYEINCAICHGEKGDGAGYLVRDADPATGDTGGKYPAQPANFLIDPHLTASNGHYYHSIMFGKNVMGAYKDKLSYEERWQVIHYIRSLQAKAGGQTYSADANTLNPTFGVPMASIERTAMSAPAPTEGAMEDHGDSGSHGEEEHGEHHGDESHSGDHSGDSHSGDRK